MKTTLALTFLFLALGHISPTLAVTFEWATIGNPGNAPDTEVMNDGTTGYGSVTYTYRLSKHEVTNAQYTEFLNAVATTDVNGLYATAMGLETQGGIVRTGSPGSYTYEVKPDAIGKGPGGIDVDDYTYGNKPVVYVSFFDTMRFTNWLENGQPTGAQDASTTESGVYTIDDGLSETRNPSASFFIPSEDEWYKAAYHKNDGVTGNYWDYPTTTDSRTNNNLPSADTGNSANYFNSDYTTGDLSYPMTDVGAYIKSASPYGTFDEGGNVWEWNEAIRLSVTRGVRGGGWPLGAFDLRSSDRINGVPSSENIGIGFRVGSIPEPKTLFLGIMAIGMLLQKRWPLGHL